MISMNRSSALAVIITGAALAGCGGSSSDTPIASTQTVSAQTVTTRVAPGLRPAQSSAADAARRYALAARTSTAATYEAQYHRQLKLSAGQLHAALRQLRPTRGQLQQLRVDHAASQATVIAITARQQTPTRASFLIVLQEDAVSAGRRTRQRTKNIAMLRNRRGVWRVTAFTVVP